MDNIAVFWSRGNSPWIDLVHWSKRRGVWVQKEPPITVDEITAIYRLQNIPFFVEWKCQPEREVAR